MPEMGKAYIILVRKPEENRPLKSPRYRWEDTIRMNLRETGLDNEDWMHLAQDKDQWQAVVITTVNLQIPQKEWLFLTR